MSPLITTPSPHARSPRSRRRRIASLGATTAGGVLVLGLTWSGAAPAYAADPILLGTAESFAVLAGSEVTNTGPSLIARDLGVSPGSSVTGFPPGIVTDGTQHVTDAVALQAQSDLTTAYLQAANQPTDDDLTGTDLGGLTLLPGVYEDTSDMQLTGTVTLNAQGDPDAVFIFKAGSTLTTASGSSVELINGASPCNVFWQVSSTAILGTGTDFKGTVMALTSATLGTDADVVGRILVRNAEVTLDSNDIDASGCSAPPASSAPPTATATTTPSDTSTASDSPGPSGPGGPDGPGDSTPTPIVPVGHPETGLDPVSGGGGPVLLYLLASLATLGAVVSVVVSARTTRTH